MVKQLTPEDISRLKQLITDGVQVLQECEDLKAGLSDTVKAIAEELEVKPSQLQKLIKLVHKDNINEEREKVDELEDLLAAVGRGLP